jgi:hypothetical protein
MSLFTILGIRCVGGVRAALWVSRGQRVFVHIELTPGAVTIVPAWKLHPVYCARLKIGARRVSLATLSGGNSENQISMFSDT